MVKKDEEFLIEEVEEEEEESEEEGENEGEEENGGEGEGENEEGESNEVKKYDVGGNKLTAEEAVEAYNNLQKDYTKKSQELAEISKADNNKQEKKEEEFDPEDEKIAESLFTILKKKHGLMTREEVEEAKQLEDIDRNFKELEKTYKGDDDLPKFKTDEVLAYMKEHNYPPHLAEKAFEEMHKDKFIAKAVKDTLAKKGGYKTETKKGEAQKTKKEAPLETKEDVENFIKGELAKGNANDELS